VIQGLARDPGRPVGIVLAFALMLASATVAMPPVLLPLGLVLGTTLIALACHDLAQFRLPDLLTLPLLLAGLAASLLLPAAEPAEHVIGALLGFAVPAAIGWTYRLWRGRDGLGLGDAKLLAAGGAWLGWQALPTVLFVAAIAGIGWFAVLRLRGITDDAIPFGVPIAGAIWLCWLMGPLRP
jgi:leader peptidase (prepilin peptidase)/N-methyltransferase